MATNLHGAGFTLRVFNRDRGKAASFAAQGIAVSESPAEAARDSEFVVSMVSDDTATHAVMRGESGVLAGVARGAIIVDCSTNSPQMARTLAQAATERGCSYLDAPVLGSVAQARNRELVFLVGGEAAPYARAEPLFRAMGRMARHAGGSGAGATIKLINNMLSGVLVAALAEAAHVAEAAGVDHGTALELLSEGGTSSRMLKAKLPKMFKRDFMPQFQLALMEKDLRYFVHLAEDLDQPAPVASLVRAQYQSARRADLGKLDVAAMFLQGTHDRSR
jgi:3-hydroxyisobutyrate dehydrogenase